MNLKADYVRAQAQTRKHHCHWPGCSEQVPPAMWGCKAHWFKIPKPLRDAIWRTYSPGQEVKGTPSAAYVAAANAVQAWIRTQDSPLKWIPSLDGLTYVNPSAPGLYATLVCWDAAEGVCLSTARWSGQAWDNMEPITGFAGPFKDAFAAGSWADANDPDL